MAKRRRKKNATPSPQDRIATYPKGTDPLTAPVPTNEGYEERIVIAVDGDGFLLPPAQEEDGTVVVQDYDPTNPGAPIAEPQKVLRPHDRIQRKRDRGSRE
jgi:hypothetical protein